MRVLDGRRLKALSAVGLAAVLAGALGGCQNMASGRNPMTSFAAAPGPVTGAAPTAFPLPWQTAMPRGAPSSPEGEMITAEVPGMGLVRATRTTMAGLGKPLASQHASTRAVAPCRDAMKREAVKVGGKDVEAVAAGPERRVAGGRTAAPVHLRITYAQPGGLEVREATLTCTVDAKGRVVDASPVERG